MTTCWSATRPISRHSLSLRQVDRRLVQKQPSPDIFVIATARTAIGTFGGALKDVPNTQLATTAVKAAIERSGVAPDAIGHVAMGNVIRTETKNAYFARVARLTLAAP